MIRKNDNVSPVTELSGAEEDSGWTPERIESLYALDMAALHGRPVCQGHADYCAAHGHGKNIVDGVERGWCPRCGEVTIPAVPAADLKPGQLAYRHGDRPEDARTVDHVTEEVRGSVFVTFTEPRRARNRTGLRSIPVPASAPFHVRPVPFSDDKLRQDIADYESGTVTAPGPARQARHLLRVPQPHRMAVAQLSTYIMNTSPGWRPSDATGEAVRIYEREGIEGVTKR